MDETRKKILESDEFVLQEIERLRVFYVLKQEIRYELAREEEMHTESVAEHIYGMFIISRYFLPLEDPDGGLDRKRIDDMILYHDIDEIETGDTIGWKKTNEHKSIELSATKQVISHVPEHLRKYTESVIAEYHAQRRPEARFVKAIDKLEPVFQLYSEHGMQVNKHHHATFEQHMRIKRPALEGFPIMQRFNEVAGEDMRRKGHFTGAPPR